MFGFAIFYLTCVIGIINSYNYDPYYPSNRYGRKRQRPEIKLYYESKCPACKDFDTRLFPDVVKILGPYIDIYTYPYGKAETIYHNNGSIDFQCQHGPEECYGNKLHVCAINSIPDYHKALLFNSCMMDKSRPNGGSNDESADQCAAIMGINSNIIKNCAKSYMSSILLSSYGLATKAANLRWVPHILINGAEWKPSDDHTFLAAVCKAFTSPPAVCHRLLYH